MYNILPEEIVHILNEYDKEVAEEISNINLAISKIKHELESVNNVLIDELSAYAKNTGMRNQDKETDLLKSSQLLRKYIGSIQAIMKDVNTQLDIFTLIVLSNTLKCSASLSHHAVDINAKLPVVTSDGNIEYITVPASYCKECGRYTILRHDFKKIDGIVLCNVTDESIQYSNSVTDDLDITQKQSELYKYGYNVKSTSNITKKQRHIILASLVECNILTRRQITDHLTTLIDRGSKIPNWKEATDKWKQDRTYIENYRREDLPNVIFDKIINKSSSKK